MLRRGSSTNARTREEILYWRNLNPFFKVDLHADFRSGLEIPLYFSENVKGKLHHNVVLKGPSADIDTWDVQLKTNDDTTRFVGEGWQDFVTAFSLEENDSLVFKYKNNSYFKVRIFDGKTSCEKESSHFVIKSVSNRTKESCSPVQNTQSFKQEIESEGEKIRHNDYYSSIVGGLKEIESDDSDDQPLVFRRREIPKIGGLKEMESNDSDDPPLLFSRRVIPKIEPEGGYMYPLRSREHTAKEIERVRQQAKEIQRLTKNSFFVALSRSHVSGTMKLGIPKQWWSDFVKAKSSKHLVLRLKDELDYDPQLYFCCYDGSNSSGTITTGWKNFVQKNSLYEFDCCVFSIDKPLEENCVFIPLEVQIIRAMLP
ncbi:hypothetical protein BVRB_5g107890 [Beta vulgaris subsp. vulgaris]|uniref:B3 domain-containing protein REM16 isoform X2 n=1 Tax=Beta vulgaris subsp. vulgaris TaxID=3555 RepID=UPI0005400904|nr:B3 domain-containing protein REM16 isoform X2 [Beta vulgaris subsp. vulgaris]KMT11464.1 hypothetical protein BVRB_5g107890 [Beta vulgaris subsp. vulgaris]